MTQTSWDENVLARLLSELRGEEVSPPEGAWPTNVVRLSLSTTEGTGRIFRFPDALTVNSFCVNYVVATGRSVFQTGTGDGFAGYSEGHRLV